MAHKLGILGGTFDPIHIGHVILAIRAREQLGLDDVLLMPNEQSPLKEQPPEASFADRLAMAELAVADCPGIAASDIDGQRSGVSYMIDTLRTLRTDFPNTEFTLILGSDALRDFPSWRSTDDIQTLARLAAVARAGECLADIPVPHRVIEMPRIDISASDIRDRVQRDVSIAHLTPQPVVEFIRERQLYKSR